MQIVERVYRCSPTLGLFHGSNAYFRGIMGPIRSGKTTACIQELSIRAQRQLPDGSGVRATRWLVVRESYPKLLNTTIPSWRYWFPGTVGEVRESVPITCQIRRPLSDGTRLDMHVTFLSVDKADPDQVGSMEMTGVWANEARELRKETLDMLGRPVGRFPAKADGGPTWSGIIADTNPPPRRHWWYSMAEEVKPGGWEFYRQPSVMLRNAEGRYVANPLAENVEHQDGGYDYWWRQIPGKDPDWINVYIMGEYGSIWEGKPVYDGTFSEAVHVARRPLALYRGLPLYLGWDLGLMPACVAGQMSPTGQLRILREWIGSDTGLRQFVAAQVKPALLNEYAGMRIISTCDPSGVTRSQADETTCVAELGRLGIPTEPAVTNVFSVRRQAQISFLTRMLGEDPGFLIDPSCRTLIEGMAGGYQFRRIQVAGGQAVYGDERDAEPLKNSFSHVCESCSYLCTRLDPALNAETRLGRAVPERKGWG